MKEFYTLTVFIRGVGVGVYHAAQEKRYLKLYSCRFTNSEFNAI